MSDLTFIEKSQIENLFGMRSGYVMDFTNQTFQEFILDSLEIDIYDKKYDYNSNSKANRLRAFFKIEPNYTVSKLLEKLLEYWLAKARIGEIDYYQDEEVYKACMETCKRLSKNESVDHPDAIQVLNDSHDFRLLVKSIQESIKKNEPEVALDRLHTYCYRFIRQICDKHEIKYEKNDSLNSLFGKYIKHLISNKLLDSSMAEKILKSSISILEAFNDVRNNRSFAHDNPILNHNESLLIFNNITNTLKFIQTIEFRSEGEDEFPDFDPSDLAEFEENEVDDFEPEDLPF